MNISIPASLPHGFTVEVDNVDKAGWHDVLDRFSDANIYQSWSYEAMRGGEQGTSRLVLRKGVEVVAAAQARIVKTPLVNVGVAYFRWGPVWRTRARAPDPQCLALTLACIRDEYVRRRGLSVRILPYLHSDQREALQPVLTNAHYDLLPAETPQRTLLIPLAASLPELRVRLEQKWRNCLNRAEKNELVIEEGTDDELFEQFIRIHQEMRDRKRFEAMSDVNAFRAIQQDLPERHKMRVFLATAQGKLAAGVVSSKIGDFGIFLHGATSDSGMTSNASYLLQWRALEWLKAHGADSYNLHGINPVTNPGTYRFKAGLCGRNGRDVHYLGTYESRAAGTAQALVDLAQSMRRVYRTSRTAIRQLRAATKR